MSTSHSVANVSKKSGSKGSEGVRRYVYSSPGSRSDSAAAKLMTDGEGETAAADEAAAAAPAAAAAAAERACCCASSAGAGSSAAEAERRDLTPGRRNMLGRRARARLADEESPCSCWKESNSASRALRERRNSRADEA